MIRALIVDDEALARRGVRVALRSTPDIQIVGECDQVAEAIKMIQVLRPDLVFLDIQMPGSNAFDMLEAIDPAQRPLIVFLTAYDQYAVRAFSFRAIDYLLKPIDDERLQAALDCARQRLVEQMAARTKFGSSEYISQVSVKFGARRVVVPVDEIDWIKASGDYISLHCGGKTYLMRETLDHLSRRLRPDLFCRIHRSTIVARKKIREVRSLATGDFIVRLHSGTELRASRRYRQEIRSAVH